MLTVRSIFLFITIFALSVLSFAAEVPKVELTSFRMAGPRNYVAEVCGKATGLSASANIRIIVDEKSKTPGVYHTHAETDGAFCVAVVTYYGTASASIESTEKTFASSMRLVSAFDKNLQYR